MHINSMPDLVLRLIFHKLSLDDLFKAGRVCLLWKSHQLAISQKVHSVTLLFGGQDAQSLITDSCFTLKYRDLLLNEDGTRMYPSQHLSKWYRLTNYRLSEKCVNELLNFLPNITTLEIAFNKVLFRRAMPLLVKWASKLESLKMYFPDTSASSQSITSKSQKSSEIELRSKSLDFQIISEYLISESSFLFESYSNWMKIKEEPKDEDFVKLLKVINSMNSLKHLTLHYKGRFISANSQIYDSNLLELSILGKLSEFYFKSYDAPVDFILKLLQDYAVSNDSLKQIGLDLCTFQNEEKYESFYRRFPSLVPNFVHLPSSYQMSLTLHTFKSLTYLDLHFCTNEHLLSGKLNFLGPLKQLTHLHLGFTVCQFDHLLEPDEIDQITCLQLVSVQVLTIALDYIRTIMAFECNRWAYVFPNVQVIGLDLKIVKGLCPFRYSEYSVPKYRLERTLSPFLICPKLHHIFTEVGFRKSSIKNDPPEFAEWIVQQGEDQSKTIVKVGRQFCYEQNTTLSFISKCLK